jgi:hypothetical protein
MVYAALQMGQTDRDLVEFGSDPVPQLCQCDCVGTIVLRYNVAQAQIMQCVFLWANGGILGVLLCSAV